MKNENISASLLDELLHAQKIDRRKFIQTSGGIAILFSLYPTITVGQGNRRRYPSDFNAYLLIGTDGRVSCYTGKIEMGQGIITSLAQMLAEELDVALDQVDMVMGDTLLCPWDGGTTGSRSTKVFGPALRRAGAEARAVLMQLASEKLGVPVEDLWVDKGVVSVKSDSDKSMSYAELAQGQRIERNAESKIKHFSEHKVSGKPVRRSDIRDKVTGAAKFAGDIRLPGMLYARVLRPPSHAAKLKSVDTTQAKAVSGVIVVEQNGLIAVLHEQPDMAEKAIDLVMAEYDSPASELNNETVFDHLLNLESEKRPVTEKGDIAGAKSDKTFDETYYNHYVAHAPIETHTVLVDVNADMIDVWCSSQTPFRVQEKIADILNVKPEQVHLRAPFIGGGFGGKKSGTEITEAAQLAQITGKPVQIAFNRKEEFFYDAFRPAAVIHARSGIDERGRITFWDFDHYYPGNRSAEPIYDIPHYRVLSNRASDVHPFDTGAWRGPGSNTNVFAMESHTDVMAWEAGMDPLSFRLKNLSDKRMVRVLKAAADQFGKTFYKGPSGKGYGIACTDYLNTYVATMAEVEVDERTGVVTVKRVVSAQDMGEIINPLGARLQMEGGITMGIGYCLGEEIEFNGGEILTENFDTYSITRFSWAPVVEAILIDNPELAPQGCGEPAITTSGAVIANAVSDAIGIRMHTLPMIPERVLDAIKTRDEQE